jgi:hypothetical protein
VASQQVSAIVTVLDAPFGDQIRAIWQVLQEDCLVQNTLAAHPIPHFSWHGARGYDEQALDIMLEKIASQTRPFMVRTTGIGLFTGSNLVIFISLVKNHSLAALHAQIWERTHELGTQLNNHYRPENWMPHITLALDPLDEPSIACVLRSLAFKPFSWEIPVDHFAIIHAGQAGSLASGLIMKLRERKRFRFSG